MTRNKKKTKTRSNIGTERSATSIAMLVSVQLLLSFDVVFVLFCIFNNTVSAQELLILSWI